MEKTEDQLLPSLKLPVQPPIEPMLAQLTRDMPSGPSWLYEPKWDSFRSLVFWDGDTLVMQSRDLKPLGRYFPEVEAGLRANLKPGLVLDGEIVVAGPEGLDFDALLQRIHPAASRIKLLSEQARTSFVAFHLLVEGSRDLRSAPQSERHASLEEVLSDTMPPIYVTPATTGRDLAHCRLRSRRALLEPRPGRGVGRLTLAGPVRRFGRHAPCRVHVELQSSGKA